MIKNVSLSLVALYVLTTCFSFEVSANDHSSKDHSSKDHSSKDHSSDVLLDDIL